MKHYIWLQPDGSRKYNANTDFSANSAYTKATIKGPISTLPQVPGLVLYKNGHVAVFEGGDSAIESRGFSIGTIRSKVKDVAWTHWFCLPTISYAGYEHLLQPDMGNFPYQAQVVTQSTPLNIRKEAGSGSVSIAQAAKGSFLTVLGYSTSNTGWFKVTNGTVTGYSDGQYLKKVDDPVGPTDPGDVGTPPPTEEPKPLYKAQITGIKTALNLRTGPSMSASTIVLMPNNATVEVLEEYSPDFYKVHYGEITGYCTASYLKKLETPATEFYNVWFSGVTWDVVEAALRIYPGAIVAQATINDGETAVL